MNTFKDNIKNIIKENINKVISEKVKEEKIKNIVTEEIRKQLSKKIIKEENDNKCNAVMKALKDNLYNHAELAYKLYPSNDDSEKATARSLFAKKANGTPDSDGQVRHFNDDEVNKLYSLLRKRK